MELVKFERPAEARSSPHERELDHLRKAAEESRQSRCGRVVVLHGPQGAGADALLAEWKRELHRGREHVFEGDCLPQAKVYAPLSEVVSAYYRSADDQGLIADDLVEIFGPVARALGIPRLTELEDEVFLPPADVNSPILFYEGLGRLLTELSNTLPGVIILRDVHHADSATRAALTYLIQNVITDPVGSFAPDGMQTASFQGLLVLSVSSESDEAHALRRTLSDHESVSFLNLRGAAEETVRRFLTSPDVVKRFVDSSGGTTDNLEALLETIPEKVEDLFLRRCEQLDAREVEVLGVLAVFGKPVGPDLLLRILTGNPVPSLLSSLFEKRVLSRRVVQGQLLVDLPTADNRRLLYDRLNPSLRADIHERIATLLEERARYGEPADLVELAHHYLRGTNREKAVEYGIAAAERLHISFAYESAIDLLEHVLPLLDEGVQRQQVLDRLIDLLACHSQQRRALYYCGLLKKELPPGERGPLYRRIGQMLLELGSYRSALRILDRARELIGSDLPAETAHSTEAVRDELIHIDAAAAEAFYGRGQYDRVVGVAERGLNQIMGSPNADAQRQIIRLTNTLGKVYLFREDYIRAARAFSDNHQRASELSWVHEALQARFNLGTIALQRRKYDESEVVFCECLNSTYTAQNPIIRAFCLMNLGVVYHKTHRYEQALDAYLHGLATFKKSGNDLQFAVVAMNLGSLYHTIGDLTRARALVETSLTVTRARDIKFYQGWGLFVRAGVSLDENRLDEAESDLEQAFQTMTELGSASWRDRIRTRQARLAFERGHYEQVEELVGAIHLDASSREAIEAEAEGLLWLGRARAKRENARASLAAFIRSREIFERIDNRERLWFTDRLIAEHFIASDDARAAKRALRFATELIEELGTQVPETLKDVFRSAPDRERVFELQRDIKRSRRRPVAPVRHTIPLPAKDEYKSWRARYSRIVGENPKLLQIFRMIDKVADSDSTILIQGESGTGKELIAEAIHENSSRRDGPFVKVNCAAFVETLLLSELFGHEKGAFTGAMTRKKGRFELAHGGTLFLDEIGDISPNTQVALLRVLQERTFDRVGGSEPIDVDVRVIVATNRNLEELVRRETFRLDLYYRLKGVITELPPLRDRRPDVVHLLRHFVEKYQPVGRSQTFTREALTFLASYSWPGNVRELENFTRSMTLFVDDQVIDLPHVLQFEEFFADGEALESLPDDFFDALEQNENTADRPEVVPSGTSADAAEAIADSGADKSEQPTNVHDLGDAMLAWAAREGVGLPDLRRRLELECIGNALRETDGNITKAAKLLDMKRPRLSQIINATPKLAALKRELTAAEK